MTKKREELEMEVGEEEEGEEKSQELKWDDED